MERRLRRGEVSVKEIQAHLSTLEDASEKLTLSAPLDEPDDRAHERRPMARIVASIDPLLASLDDDDYDDLDDEDDDDLDDEDDDDDDDL